MKGVQWGNIPIFLYSVTRLSYKIRLRFRVLIDPAPHCKSKNKILIKLNQIESRTQLHKAGHTVIGDYINTIDTNLFNF